ncbi:MAG: hypothetical protein JXA72_11915 [Bacteroidales bacterium]|nr:hypothetical protein [Bacteroidales bacterium]
MFQRFSLFGNLKSGFSIAGVFIALPALLIHLGVLPLIGDESIRALVTLEMILSGDFFTPTLNGIPYFNKPPLFNWILSGFYLISGRNDELITRLPTIFALFAYCFTIYFWIKKELGSHTGILATMMFLTCGRILFWDSFLGLIDLTYSWLVFMNFMITWYYIRKQKFTTLYLLTYFILAVAFLLKGLPSLVFQAITLLAAFTLERKFIRLFSWKHLAGIGIFIATTGTYYVSYAYRNPDLIDHLLLRLITESTDKSAIGATVMKTILHFLIFPFEVLYHFLPWTLFALFLFHGKILSKALKNNFIRYCVVIFLSNIIIYWTSPITYPRYLLMLMPLFFVVVLYMARMHTLAGTVHFRIVKVLLFTMMAILMLSSYLLPAFSAKNLPVEQVYLKSFLILLAGGLVMMFPFMTKKANLIFSFGLMLLISRISFNLFLIPYRQSESWADKCRSDAITIAHLTKNSQLYCLTDTIMIPNAYYLTREREEILCFREFPEAGPYYILSDTISYGKNLQPKYTMRIPHPDRKFFIGKFTHEEP